jgi:1-acyl-sn-glycerol-3-phosphate acyltransferase
MPASAATRPPLLAALADRIAAARAEPALQRDPAFIRRHLPDIARYTSYFSPEIRGLDRLPADGPILVVGNHSGLFYMPEVWVCGQAVLARRGVDQPSYLLAYDLLLAVPGVGRVLRRLGALPARASDAEQALRNRGCVVVYPGGDREACRPWTDRNRIDFGGRAGFVRLALRCGVPVVPAVAHGGQHAVVIISRGERVARALGLPSVRIKVFPFLAGPFGITSVLTPPPPMPAQLILEFLPPLDWTGYGAGAAEDPAVVAACYADITGRMQAALDRLAAERPYPVLAGMASLAARAARRLLPASAGQASAARKPLLADRAPQLGDGPAEVGQHPA